MIDGVAMVGLRLLHAPMPPNGSMASLLVILVGNEIFRGYMTTVLGIMFVSMLADTLDVQELATGKRQEWALIRRRIGLFPARPRPGGRLHHRQLSAATGGAFLDPSPSRPEASGSARCHAAGSRGGGASSSRCSLFIP